MKECRIKEREESAQISTEMSVEGEEPANNGQLKRRTVIGLFD